MSVFEGFLGVFGGFEGPRSGRGPKRGLKTGTFGVWERDPGTPQGGPGTPWGVPGFPFTTLRFLGKSSVLAVFQKGVFFVIFGFFRLKKGSKKDEKKEDAVTGPCPFWAFYPFLPPGHVPGRSGAPGGPFLPGNPVLEGPKPAGRGREL